MAFVQVVARRLASWIAAEHYVPLPGGQRFVTLAGPPHLAAQRINVLLNWRSALHR
jgi:hypothetical protein